MAVVIRDKNTEQQIDSERERRGHKTNAKTARECLAEYFALLRRERRADAKARGDKSTASATAGSL